MAGIHIPLFGLIHCPPGRYRTELYRTEDIFIKDDTGVLSITGWGKNEEIGELGADMHKSIQ